MSKFKCFICGGTRKVLIKEHTRDSEHSVVCCLNCGMQQLYPCPSIEEDADYYDLNAHDRLITPDFSIEELFKKFMYQNQSRINYLEQFGIKKEWKMLDFASGYGFFMKMMMDSGYSMDGIEISNSRLRICEEEFGEVFSQVYNVNLLLEDVPEKLQNNYDLVTMFHFLEHTTAPYDLLNKIKRIIKPNGYLVIEIPNVNNTMMKISKEFNDFFYIRDHVAYYTPELLRKVVEESGYRVVELRGNQVYGLTNHMNWIINGRPEMKSPSYESCDEMKWIEKVYREKMNTDVTAEYMYVIAQRL